MIENSTALTMDCLTSIMLKTIIYVSGQNHEFALKWHSYHI